MASKIPDNLRDLKRFLAEQLEIEPKNFGIRGSCGARRSWGFHLDRASIFSDCGYGAKDYSIAHKRNRRNLTEFSSALDGRLPAARLKAITAYMAALGRSGYVHPAYGRTLFYEVIGPNARGEATRWAVDTGWLPTKATKDHEWHFHIGLWRDVTRYGVDLRVAFLDFFGLDELPADPVTPPPPAPDEPIVPLPPEPGETPPPPDPEQPAIDEQTARIHTLEAAMSEAIALLSDALTETEIEQRAEGGP